MLRSTQHYLNDWLIPWLIWGWLLPVAAIGVLIGLVIIRRALKMQQAEDPQAMSCANCGYDLRGGVGTTCPECGTNLVQGVSAAFPIGAIRASGLHKPFGRVLRTLVFLVIGLPPVIIGVFGLGLMMPFNYRDEPDIDLRASVPPGVFAVVDHLAFYGRREIGWTGSEPMQQMTISLNMFDMESVSLVPAEEGLSASHIAEQVWDSLKDHEHLLVPGSDRDAMRRDFIDFVEFIAEGDKAGAEALAKTSDFDLYWIEYIDVHVHPLYQVAIAVSGLAALVVLVIFAGRSTHRRNERFKQRVQMVVMRYRELVDANRERAAGQT